MLQLRSPNGRTVTRPMTNSQAVSRVRHGKEGVVQEESREEKTQAPVLL